MRSTILALLLALPAAAAPLSFEVRYRPLASRARVLHAFFFDPDDPTNASIREAFGNPPEVLEAAEVYGRIAARFLERAAAEGPREELPAGSHGVLPPRSGEDPNERLQLAFLRARTPGGAARELGLSARDRRALEAAFGALEPAFQDVAGDAARHRAAARAMNRLARERGAGAFLARAARFFDVTSSLDPRLEVSLLWLPPGRTMLATQATEFMVVPVPMSWLRKERFDQTLRDALATAVHEFGHYLYSLVRKPSRSAMADLLTHYSGIPNPGRVNTFDEGLQSALGNLIYEQDHLGEGFDPDAPVYSYLAREPYPHAIDAVARALEPLVRESLDLAGGFRRKVLPAYPALQDRLFGRRPRHFAAVSTLYATRAPDRRVFNGLFRGRDRYSFGPPLRDDFLARGSVHPGSSRWMLLRPEDLGPSTVAALGASTAPPEAALERVRSGRARGFWWARRRTPRGGFDFWVVAGEPPAMRELLEQVWAATELPEGRVVPLR
jgi:hypothetical protein